ncbi:MAG: hypothetical protein ACXW04_01990 [Methylobacter sp.]
MRKLVIPVGKRVSSAMDGKLKPILGPWIHAGLSCPAPRWGKCQPAPGGLVRQSMPE